MSYNNCTILSDLHWEFHPDYGLSFSKFIPDNEFLILAGDIACWKNDLRFVYFDAFFELSKKFSKILYVFGNHEYYKSNLYEAKNKAQCCLEKLDNLIILDNHQFTIICYFRNFPMYHREWYIGNGSSFWYFNLLW